MALCYTADISVLLKNMIVRSILLQKFGLRLQTGGLYQSSMSKKKVAFFDIDGTIFRWSLFIDYVEKLIEKDVLPKSLKDSYKKEYQAWLNREGSYEDYLKAMIQAFDENIKGVHIEDFKLAVKEALQGKEKRVYVFTRDLILKLKKKNYFLVAITRSAKIAADIFAQSLDFDKVYGVRFEIDSEGFFTGKILDKEIFNKGSIVKRVVEKENLSLKDSYAVGDTDSDIPMLELVDNPIVFNPNGKLFNYAKDKKWTIIVERKDVIYNLDEICSEDKKRS